MPSIDALNLRIPVRSPTLIGLNLSLATLVGIASKRKQFLAKEGRPGRRCSPREVLLRRCVCQRAGGTGEGPKEWSRRHGPRSGVGGVGEQPEKAATTEVLAVEDDDGGIPLPDFTSRCCGQALGAGGAR
jgi:hypothetical protein